MNSQQRARTRWGMFTAGTAVGALNIFAGIYSNHVYVAGWVSILIGVVCLAAGFAFIVTGD